MHTSTLLVLTLVALLLVSSGQTAAAGPGAAAAGGQGSDSKHGFKIVDTQEKYGYESTYPGGKAEFYLIGPNRGPGQKKGGNQSGKKS